MTTETFIIYLAHFVKYVRCSEESKVLLLVDNHVSHVSLEAINFCLSHGIVMLGFPPHTTHKLQLLDVSFFGPLKKFYSQQCDSWMVSHPGNAITDRQVAELLGGAYKKAATAGNAINGFSAGGIEPFNDDVFDDSDFAASITTEHDQPPVVEPATPVRHNEEIAGLFRCSEDANDEGAVLGSSCDRSDAASDRRKWSIDDENGHATRIVVHADIHIPPIQAPQVNADTLQVSRGQSALDDGDAIGITETSTPTEPLSPWDIMPLPNAKRPLSKRKTTKRSSSIITGSPMKNALEAKELEKKENEDRKRRSMDERERRKKDKQQLKLNKKCPPISTTSLQASTLQTEENREDAICPACNEKFEDPPTEEWVQCHQCNEWWHEGCFSYEGHGQFTRDLCWST